MELFRRRNNVFIATLFPAKRKEAWPVIHQRAEKDSSQHPFVEALITASAQVAKAGQRQEAEHSVTYTRTLEGSDDPLLPNLFLTLTAPKAEADSGRYAFLLVEEQFVNSESKREVFSCNWSCSGGKPQVQYACGEWADRVVQAAAEQEDPSNGDNVSFIRNIGALCGLEP